ncbi:hypothetical protein, partial [Anaerospora hongkongensis]|uniref:hypothetical protein n=1 Tax=Anaerospora hongkongensis TaxID=244830 RepID=UPI00289CF7CB
LSALLEKCGPQDGKCSAYVKKFVCLSAASFTNFSKLSISQVFWKIGLEFLVTFVSMTKVTSRAFYSTTCICNERVSHLLSKSCAALSFSFRQTLHGFDLLW